MNDHEERPMQLDGLPVLSTGLNLAELDLHGGDGFWSEVERYTRGSQFDRVLDIAMEGRSAPRIWAFLEAPGAGHAAAAGALGAAWSLAERGQMVVLVDADEQSPWITRWLGRTQQEGWIDMVRFGASLQTASVPLPSDVRRGSVLGVGTFTPTGITPDEVSDLLNRLRGQADDLILVLPAKLRSLPWLQMAHIRLLCWDLLSRGAADTERILAEMDRMGVRSTALMGFGVEEYALIQGTLREDGIAEVKEDKAEDMVPAAAEFQQDEPIESPEPEPSTVPCGAEDAAPTPAGAADDQDDRQDAPAVAPDRSRPRTSGVFVVIAAAAIVSLVLLGLFLRNHLAPPRSVEDQLATRTVPVTEPAPALPAETDQPAVDPATRRLEADTPVAAVDPGPEEADPRLEDAVALEEGPPARDDVDAAEAPTADFSPFQQAPGRDGWALWLFSVPDEQRAVMEVARLRSLGIEAVFRTIELSDQSRWWRIYAGSFSSREAAQEAAGPLLTQLKHDWARPTRF